MAGLAAALGLAIVHVCLHQTAARNLVAATAWRSAGAGISVAFVITFLLPEISSRQEEVVPLVDGWLIALVGLVAFYVLEHQVSKHKGESSDMRLEAELFWMHVAVFAAYNVLIGYLLTQEVPDSPAIFWLYFLAIGVHLYVADEGLARHYPHTNHQTARLVFGGAIMVGWAIAEFVVLPEVVLLAATALLAGAIMLNALKEELPDLKQGRSWPFAGAALVYAALAWILRATG